MFVFETACYQEGKMLGFLNRNKINNLMEQAIEVNTRLEKRFAKKVVFFAIIYFRCSIGGGGMKVPEKVQTSGGEAAAN
jgi:hypothetical protein